MELQAGVAFKWSGTNVLMASQARILQTSHNPALGGLSLEPGICLC